jgi:hypothetical protein
LTVQVLHRESDRAQRLAAARRVAAQCLGLERLVEVRLRLCIAGCPNPRFAGWDGRARARRLTAMALLLILVQAVATATVVVPVSVRPDHEQARDQPVIAHVTTVGYSVTVQFN